MRVLVLGASGIIGQHMRLCMPPGVEPVWHRRTADRLHVGADLTDRRALARLLHDTWPDVVVNLACEGRVDVVERDASATEYINAQLPAVLAGWAKNARRHLVHVSSQAVFDGWTGPFGPESGTGPINAYGRQKASAEVAMKGNGACTLVRPTFVIGVRPLPHVGRTNPAEDMLAGQRRQVHDRWFSVLFARDAARLIWDAATRRPGGRHHLGNPEALSRYSCARRLGCPAEQASHDDFSGAAPRPVNTAYRDSLWLSGLDEGFRQIMSDWNGTTEAAREIALFLGISEAAAQMRLDRGFGAAHAAVRAEFERARPADDDRLLAWYRATEAYIWELTAYHLDRGFNYAGMMHGIAVRLEQLGARRVLCLGDGIGSLTIELTRRGLEATYNDLAGSRTAAFADFRFWRRFGKQMPSVLSPGWAPALGEPGQFDAVVSLDFMEHVVNVPEWVRAARAALRPGGWLVAQNAFGLGSGDHGSIPMHLARNDRYVTEWDSLLAAEGYRQESSNWYQVAA